MKSQIFRAAMYTEYTLYVGRYVGYVLSTPLLRQSASCIHRKIHTKFCGLDVNAVYTMSRQAKGYLDTGPSISHITSIL